MTTKTHKKSIYDSDETPSRSDREKAVELYYQDGSPSTVLMAEELAMHRRYSVKNARDLSDMRKQLNNVESLTESTDLKLTEQGNIQTTMISRQSDIADGMNQVKGIGKTLVVIVPIMLSIIGLILALK